MYLFFSLIAIARISIPMLNKSGESGHSCLIPDLRGSVFGILPLSMRLTLLSWSLFPLHQHYEEFFFFFIISRCWILSFFPHIYWDNHMVFIFQFINMVHYIDWIADPEPSLYPWDKTHIIAVYVPLNILLNSLENILLRSFASMFIKESGL